jgi:Secretion system C-terminal sorting domain
MLKKITLLFVLITTISFSQITFQKIYGGVEEEECDAVVQTEDGGFMLAASTRSYGNGNYDFYIIRTDPYGDTLWTKTFGATGYDHSRDILKIDDTNYLIAGSLSGKVYFVKIKDNGEIVWTKTIGNEDDYMVNTAKKTYDGGFIFCGNKGLEDYFIMKTDADGDSLWTKTYELGTAFSIDATTDGGYILMIRPGNWLYPQNDFVIVKTNPLGDSLWAKVFGSSNVEVGYEVEQTTDGGYMLAGRKDGATVDDSDFYLLKTDSTGEFLWDKTYGGDEMDRAFTAMQTSDGGYILGGFTASFNVEYFDFYLVKTDADGDTIWTKTYGGLWQEEIADVEETADGGYAAVGYTYSFGAGSNPNIYFIKTDANGLISDVEDHNNGNEIRFELKQNYPNPFNPSTIIQYAVSSRQFVSLKVFDVLGNEIETLVNEEKPSGTYEVTWYANNLPSGVYFYQLKAGSFIESKKMILMK